MCVSQLHITEAKVHRMSGDLVTAFTVIQFAAALFEKARVGSEPGTRVGRGDETPSSSTTKVRS